VVESATGAPDDDDAGGILAQGEVKCQVEIGLVLVGGVAFDPDLSRDFHITYRVHVPDQHVDPVAEVPGQVVPAIGGYHQLRGRQLLGKIGVGHFPSGEDEHRVHNDKIVLRAERG
jgi:hypothetical protein